jgi:coenzyme F420-0:L-glutamate ligase / coenzyme F420-1:gamma-L-glutamate ligase
VIALVPVTGIPLVEDGADLGQLIVTCLGPASRIEAGDVLVIAQKIVSKSEGRTVSLADIEPTKDAISLGTAIQKDPRIVELILRESREIVRTRPGLVLVEDTRGLVCANAGIDRSNIQQHGEEEEVALLPVDPDASAQRIRQRIHELTGHWIGVIVNDSHGRAWREGTVGVAIGLAGLPGLWDRCGEADLTGYVLQHTVIGLADEIAAAASMLMGAASEGIPAVLIRGLTLPPGNGTAREIQRPKAMDLFR